jgi:RNA polymerase sigma-70 factor (ECF subfamily)
MMQNHINGHAARTDECLVLLAQAGAIDAFGELARRHYGTALRLATTILRNRDDAEDEVQNAFMRAHEHIREFERGCRFTTWLTRIVINHCLMRIRRERRRRAVSAGREPEPADPRSAPDREFARIEMGRVLASEVRRIPPLLRRPFELRHVHHLPLNEVARRLGISVPAAKSRLLRARLELQQRLRRHQGQAGTATLLRL